MRQPMALFVDPEDVILRMQLDKTLSGIIDVVTSGIVAAQLHVERIIDGKLARHHQDCLFHIDTESFSGIAPGGAYRLEIPSGLIRQDVPQVVNASSGTIEGPFTGYEAVDSSLLRFDYPRGYLHLDTTYGDHHVRVQCDTGYEDGTRPLPPDDLPVFDDTVQYDVGAQVAYQETPSSTSLAYTCLFKPLIGTLPTDAQYWERAKVPQESIPDPIYEAIMSLVPMVFNAQQTTNRSDEAQKQYQTLTDHANLLLQSFVRTKGFSFRQMFGQVG